MVLNNVPTIYFSVKRSPFSSFEKRLKRAKVLAVNTTGIMAYHERKPQKAYIVNLSKIPIIVPALASLFVLSKLFCFLSKISDKIYLFKIFAG